MTGRTDIRDLWAGAQRRNSQNLQWAGRVVSADGSCGTVVVDVRGRLLECSLAAADSVEYGQRVMVGRVPGSSRLAVVGGGSGGTTVINNIVQEVSSGGGDGGGVVPPPSTPATPLNLEATATSSSTIDLEWSSTGDNTESYVIERLDPGDEDFSIVWGTEVGCTVWTDTGLLPSTTYTYRVKAVNKFTASAYSNEASATTLVSVGTNVAICNSTQLIVTSTFQQTTPAWIDATPALQPGDVIQSFVIGPDSEEAWCITAGGDKDTSGIFHCSNIFSPSWTLVLSQTDAETLGKAALGAAGWTNLDFGTVRSAASGNGGTLVAVENKWSGFQDRDPSCVFVTTNNGVSWAAYVPSGGAAHRFGAEEYNDLYGGHRIEYSGGSYVIGGSTWWPYFNGRQATATSADGVSWVINETAESTYWDPRSRRGDYALFDSGYLVSLPNTQVQKITNHGRFFAHTYAGGVLSYLYEYGGDSEARNLYNEDGADVLDSDDVFGSQMGCAAKYGDGYVAVPRAGVSGAGAVKYIEDSVVTDKTGDLAAWDGGSPVSHYDNCQIEVF